MKLFSSVLFILLTFLILACLGENSYAVETDPACTSIVQLNWREGHWPNESWYSYSFSDQPCLTGPEAITLHVGDFLSVDVPNPSTDSHFNLLASNQIYIASDVIGETWSIWSLDPWSSEENAIVDNTSDYIFPVRWTNNAPHSAYQFSADEAPLTFYFSANTLGKNTITFYVNKAVHTPNHLNRVNLKSQQHIASFTLTVTVVQ